MTSRAIASVGYDADTQQMEVEMRTGEVFLLTDIPCIIYRNLISSESPGTYYYLHIRKGDYPSRRLR